MLDVLRANDLPVRESTIARVNPALLADVTARDWQRVAWQLGLTLICFGAIPTRTGYPRTTITTDASQIVAENAT